MFSVSSYPTGIIPAEEPESTVWIPAFARMTTCRQAGIRDRNTQRGSSEYKNLLRMLNKYVYFVQIRFTSTYLNLIKL